VFLDLNWDIEMATGTTVAKVTKATMAESKKRNVQNGYQLPLPKIPRMHPVLPKELPHHQQIMDTYKVYPCTDPTHMNPDIESNVRSVLIRHCFNWHKDLEPRRRRPIMIHGCWNYIPVACRFQDKEKKCDQTDFCRFAHNSVEICFHPSKYKTEYCEFATNPQTNSCSRYQEHCAKVHHCNELRSRILEPKLDGLLKSLVPNDLILFVAPSESRTLEHLWYMKYYKIQKCEGFPYDCKCNGLKYHNDTDRRRPTVNYDPIPCPKIKPLSGSRWSHPLSTDCKKRKMFIETKDEVTGRTTVIEEVIWDCHYAHTLLEIMYHPIKYKTSLCAKFSSFANIFTWRCKWGRDCAHAHGTSDLRIDSEILSQIQEHNLCVKKQESEKIASASAAAAAAPVQVVLNPREEKGSAEVKLPNKYQKCTQTYFTDKTLSLQQKFEISLTCPQSDRSGQLHLLNDPIQTTCCCRTICRRCIDRYMSDCAYRFKRNAPLFIGQSAVDQSLVFQCNCSFLFTQETSTILKRKRTDLVLSNLLTVLSLHKDSTAAAVPAAAPIPAVPAVPAPPPVAPVPPAPETTSIFAHIDF
jgi:hypothetical protein